MNTAKIHKLHSYKHFFFDLDNTLTRSKSTIENEDRSILESLLQTVIVISGAHHLQIQKQLNSLPVIRMGQNGNHTFDSKGNELWKEVLSEQEISEIESHIRNIRPFISHNVPNEHDLIDNRGAQISFSVLGHTSAVRDKELCDPEQVLRKCMLQKFPLNSSNVEVRIAGTTCLDYFAHGKHKGFNVRRLIEHYGFEADSCLYFGDALYPGGNDETVIGVIDTIQVENFQHTYSLLAGSKQN